MKISEMSTERGMDVLCRIVEPVGRIMEDTETISSLRAGENETLAQMATRIVGVLLKTHRADTVEILAALGGVSSKKIKEQSFLTTVGQVIEYAKDEELVGFFRSYLNLGNDETT